MHDVIRTGYGLRDGLTAHRPGTGERWSFQRPFLDTHVLSRRFELRDERKALVGEAEIRDTMVFAIKRQPGEMKTAFERWPVGGWLKFPDGRRQEVIEEASSGPGCNEFRFVEALVRVARLRQTKYRIWHLQTWEVSKAPEILLVACAMIESLEVAGA